MKDSNVQIAGWSSVGHQDHEVGDHFILNAWETSTPTAKTKRATALSFPGSEEFYQAAEAAPEVLDVEILSGEQIWLNLKINPPSHEVAEDMNPITAK